MTSQELYDRFEALKRKSEYTIKGTVMENISENGFYVQVDLITNPALKQILEEFESEHVIITDKGLQIFQFD